MDPISARKGLKTFLILSVLVLAAFSAVVGGQKVYSLYTGASGGTAPTGVAVKNLTDTAATISWSTQKPSYGFVSYGSTQDLGLVGQDLSGDKLTSHSVSLKNLLPNTLYYFKVGSGEKLYGKDGGESPDTFVTESSSGGSSSGDLTEAGWEDNMYTSNPQYDLNDDGEVNSMDYELWKSGGAGL